MDLKRILIVEDVESILLAFKDFLRTKFEVVGVPSYRTAISVFENALQENRPFDFVISDVHLPDGNGLDLIQDIKNRYPKIKTALITSYEINEYIDYIQKFGIDQVISKNTHMSLHDVMVMLEKHLTGNIFGVDKYFPSLRIYYPTELRRSPWPQNRELYSVQIRSTEDRIYWTEHVSELMKEKLNVPISISKLVLDELMTNAMIRAPRDEDGSYKYQQQVKNEDKLIPATNITLDPEDYFTMQYGYYDEWVIFTTIDPNGTLRKSEILYRLKRHLSINNPMGLPEGLTDTHGRGLFLLREQLSHIIFNIERNKKTEIICLYNTMHNTPSKNISIFELGGKYHDDL
ncbi:MAG: response regulator [Candidatus Hydrogenedentota bacterium]|nr:MAG: response regulator [Candidatus Hydrogenedentota bacterium]